MPHNGCCSPTFWEKPIDFSNEMHAIPELWLLACTYWNQHAHGPEERSHITNATNGLCCVKDSEAITWIITEFRSADYYSGVKNLCNSTSSTNVSVNGSVAGRQTYSSSVSVQSSKRNQCQPVYQYRRMKTMALSYSLIINRGCRVFHLIFILISCACTLLLTLDDQSNK